MIKIEYLGGEGNIRDTNMRTLYTEGGGVEDLCLEDAVSEVVEFVMLNCGYVSSQQSVDKLRHRIYDFFSEEREASYKEYTQKSCALED